MIENVNLAYVIFDFVINALVQIINIVLAPINYALSLVIPNFDRIPNAINGIIDYLFNAFNFIFGWLHLPNEVMTIIVGYIDFLIIFIPLSLSFKIAVNFWHHFKG